MTHRRDRFALLLLLVALIPHALWGQNYKTEEHTSADGRFTYVTVPGDPLGARIYRLSNGLTVMMSVNRSTPRVQTLIAVKAGSKNDPANHTGLAHYLEHMLFKGTDRYGTADWEKERPLIEQIYALYEQYNSTTDPLRRKAIYRQIDSVSGIAASYAIPNEYDKMISSIGGQNTNAFTSVEQTVYMGDIPSNQIDKWLTIEAERFRNPVMRLFHTELEAVYEEKNISLDNGNSQAYEALMAGLFPHHPYGTQTTIGTVEHLKNPSLTEIERYYRAHYVPNNMAIILAGDFDPDRVITEIEAKFGGMKPGTVPPFTFAPEAPRTAPDVREVISPDPESIRIAYRFPGAAARESILLELTDLVLAYKGSGLIDLNLNQQQKVLQAYSTPNMMKDYSFHLFYGEPKEGQSLDEVRALLMQQIDLVKQGKFDEKALKGIILNRRLDLIRQFQQNDGRAFEMLGAFTSDVDWAAQVHRLDEMAKVSKQEIVDFAKKYYTDDYVVVYKRSGETPSVTKVEKPEITPLPLNRDAVSPFVQTLLSTPAPSVDPLFLDYGRDITRLKLPNGLPVLYLKNGENDLFSLYYVFDMGKRNDLKIPFAANYLKLLGTSTMSPEQVAKAFFDLGCSYDVNVTDDRITISLTGLRQSFEPGVKLLESLLADAKPNEEALQEMVSQELKMMADAKLSKPTILYRGLLSYATYGDVSPFKTRLTEKELRSLKAKELVEKIRSLADFQHTVMYYGPEQSDRVVTQLTSMHRMASSPKAYPPMREYARSEMKQNTVYFVDYPGMVQAEAVWVRKSEPFDAKSLPVANLFNQYYGGDMSSVVFQTIRESKALAYSTWASYSTPSRKGDPFYIYAYVGTQADKLPEAIPAMNELLNTMPEDERAISLARESLRNKLLTDRTVREGVLFSYLDAMKLGVDHDLRRDTYTSLDRMSLAELKGFHDSRYAKGNYTLCVLGSKEKVDRAALEKFGKVVDLSLDQVFGY